MNRWLALAGVFGALIVAAVAGLWFLLATEAGARWLLGHAGEPLQYGELNGTLARGLMLSELRYTQDDLSIATQSVRLKAAVGWTGITIRDARVEGLRVAMSSAGGDACADCETDVRALLEGLALPIAVRLDALEIVGASLSSDEREVFALDRLFLAGVWNDALALDRFELESPLADAAGGGRLDLREPHALDLELDAVLAPALTGMPAAADVDLDVDGTLDELLLSASSRAVGAELEAGLLTLPDDPRWEVDLRVADFESPPGQGVPVTIERLDLRSAGSFGEYSVDVTASLARPEPVRIALSGLGAGNRLTIRSLEAVHADGNLAAAGLLVFPESLELAINAAEVSPQRWLTAWPGDRAVRGSANLYLDAGALRIERGSLSVAGAPLAADFTAAYSLDTEAISFALDWRDLAWPLDEEATLGSPRGQARIDGRPDGWTASAALGVVAPGVPDGALSLAASGNRTTAVVEIEDGRILGGAIGGEARFEAGEAPGWQIDVNAQGIDTQALFADWPGTVSVAIAGRGSPDETTLTLERLSGRLLDMPLSGEGFIAYRDGELHARDVALTHGEAHVRLDGSPGAGDGLAFEFGLPELDVYPLVIGGDLAGRGRLRLTGGDALVEVDAGGTALRVAGVEAEALRITTSRADADAAIGLSVAAARIVAGDRAVDDLRLELGYADTEQTLELGFASGRYEVAVLASGAFEDPEAPLESTWNGVLSRFDVASGEEPVTSLLASVPITASAAAVRVERLCLTGSDPGELCAGIDWSEEAGIDASMALTSIPIDLVNLLEDTGYTFEQRLSGELVWRQPDGLASATGAGAFTLTAGDAVSLGSAETEVSTGPGELAFDIAGGVLRSGKLNLPLEDDGLLRADLERLDIVAGARGAVRGSLEAAANDIAFLAAFVPGVERLEGRLEARFDVAGTVGAPELSGRARLGDASALYVPLGTSLAEAEVELNVGANGSIVVDGGFRAGEGHARLTTPGDASGAALVNVRIEGEKLALIDLPDVRATADADLAVSFAPGRLDIDGRIAVPSARIYPVDLATGRVDESEDVVIVAGALPEEPGITRGPGTLEIFGRVQLDVGDDVIVDLDLATARLGGSAVFDWTGAAIPVGRGRYDLTGSVEAFGQVLDISEGGIRFPDASADNPLIRLRATREIYGNSEVKRAGVLIDGPLERPSIEAYTEPPTSEERAATLLLTGNDFNFEEGVGAVDFGTYIAPRLFLSYGVGVFDRENVISARYDLNEGFGIRATSGDRESGVDLTYRIER